MSSLVILDLLRGRTFTFKEFIYPVILVIFNPFVAILLTGSKVILGDDNMLEKKIGDGFLEMNMYVVTRIKLFEIIGILVKILYRLPIINHLLAFIGESAPQLVLSCVFIHNHGGPAVHPINTASAVFSAGSVLIGFITSVKAMYEFFK